MVRKPGDNMNFNIGDILIGVLLVAALMLAIYKMSKYQENHCDGDCARCTHSGEYDCAKKKQSK